MYSISLLIGNQEFNNVKQQTNNTIDIQIIVLVEVFIFFKLKNIRDIGIIMTFKAKENIFLTNYLNILKNQLLFRKIF
ncbi:hypothetical protein BKN14_02370 [Candidatus Gracilibacteria bacterium HOT-871]|nr:hypothetical protein BKN14_02370 [Candidatus Gracilibacteria bacterium HOT-871]